MFALADKTKSSSPEVASSFASGGSSVCRAATYLTATTEALPTGIIETVATWKRLAKRSVRKPVATLKMEVREDG